MDEYNDMETVGDLLRFIFDNEIPMDAEIEFLGSDDPFIEYDYEDNKLLMYTMRITDEKWREP